MEHCGDAPRSERFDDIYFSLENGLAESEYVFLRGNDLAARWQNHDKNRTKQRLFTIAETGFGTGLNFLAAWRLFEQTAPPDLCLDYISFERYPLRAGDIQKALARFNDALGPYLGELLANYPLRVPGFHRLMLGRRVQLTLIFDDLNKSLPQLVARGGIDAWFLDGFAPSKNPDMWTPLLYSHMAKHARPGTSFATFTAAGAVRRGLAEAGFDVTKTTGYGRKRDMSIGRFNGPARPGQILKSEPHRIAIIGGGLAGTACGWALARQGKEPVIFEAGDSLASGASGNRRGIINPRLSALRTPQSDFYAGSFAQAAGFLARHAAESGFQRCGSLHLDRGDETRQKRFAKCAQSWAWPEDHMQPVTAAQAADIAGLGPLRSGGLYLPDAGSADPAALCAFYARGLDVRCGQAVHTLQPDQQGGWLVNGAPFDAVILACSAAVKNFEYSAALPVHTVRGQTTTITATTRSAALRTNLCYGGYITPADEGTHITGATFQKWLDDPAPRSEDDHENLAKLQACVPSLGAGFEVTGHRAALRTAARDHFPLIGPLEAGSHKRLYISTAHGSHGLISTLAGAVLLADMITGRAHAVAKDVCTALSPSRFSKRGNNNGKS